jgi:hypothetical protein
MAHGHAQQKFFETLLPLVTGSEPLSTRLTLAAGALIGLDLDHLPAQMRNDLRQLTDDLMRPPPFR